jgi:protein phosphatase-4 regulatory subunit 3
VQEPRVIVESEDQPNRRLLETRIVKEDGFQKQQGTRSPAAVTRYPRV